MPAPVGFADFGAGADIADLTFDENGGRAIAAGINIVHINTELRVAWRQGLEASRAKNSNEVVPYKLLPPVIEAVKEVALSRLRLFNSVGSLAQV